MTTKPICEKCGRTITSARWERLSPGLVYSLGAAIQAVHRAQKNRFHYMDDLHLAHTAAANFQKLRFHALIAHYDKADTRSGEWLITGRGGQFLRGEIVVPDAVLVFNNQVIDHGKKTVHIGQFRNMPPDFDSKFAYEEPLAIQKAVQSGLFPRG